MCQASEYTFVRGGGGGGGERTGKEMREGEREREPCVRKHFSSGTIISTR